MNTEVMDLLIVGGGPAGLSAAIYAARGGADTYIVEKQMTGGPVLITEEIENYPGFPDGVKSQELMANMTAQAERFGAEFKKMCEATKLNISDDKKSLEVSDDGEEKRFIAKSIIIATGSRPRLLGAPGEKELSGRGVSYCATCDGPLFRDKTVVVVGGGDAAVEEALHITNFATKVIIVHRRDELRAAKILQERAYTNEKIDFVWDSVVTEIIGESLVKAVKVENVKTGSVEELRTDGVFIYVGTEPNTGFVTDVLDIDNRSFILTDDTLKTSVDGIYAAGDCRSSRLKQIVVAAGEGALAAVMGQKYISSFEGRT